MGNECSHPGMAADATADGEHSGTRLPSRLARRPHAHRPPDSPSDRLPPLRPADADPDDVRDLAAMIDYLRSEGHDDA